jgi:hypothetical protein
VGQKQLDDLRPIQHLIAMMFERNLIDILIDKLNNLLAFLAIWAKNGIGLMSA